MAVSPVSGQTSSTDPSALSSLTGGNQLGKQAFLQLLVAQLKNQDPLQPMDNTQFVSQLAQFSTLEAMQQVQSTLESSLGAQLLDHAMSLLGHTITATGSDGKPVTGTVQGIKLQKGEVLLDLGDSTVNLSDVTDIQALKTSGS